MKDNCFFKVQRRFKEGHQALLLKLYSEINQQSASEIFFQFYSTMIQQCFTDD